MLVINLAQQAEPVVEAKKEERPKSPSILAKLLAPFKGDKKEKAEKKPKEKAHKKTEKKEEVCLHSWLSRARGLMTCLGCCSCR